jgi:hypothetical protein
MTDRKALHSMLVYAHREAEEEKLGALAHLLSLAVAEIAREIEQGCEICRQADADRHGRPIGSRLQ